MLEDVTELRSMQLGIGRHSGEPGMPDGVEHIEIINAILRGDDHPVAGRKVKLVAERSGKTGGALRQLTITARHAIAVARGGLAGMAPAGTFEPKREIHALRPFLASTAD